jgi:hypothetical protein
LAPDMSVVFERLLVARRGGVAVASASLVRWGVHLGIAGIALLIFHAISLTSGRVGINDGAGWDGIGYARMVTEGMAAGPVNMQTRPLLVFVTRALYGFGFTVIESFAAMNYVYGFVLYLFTALLLERYGADTRVRAVVVWNVALCMATSKMYAFYPVLVDFGALALITAAFYLATTDRHWLAGIAAIAAASSREFGAAVAFYGIHRAIRQGQIRSALAYLPSLVAVVVIRLTVVSGPHPGPTPFSLGDAVANLALWGSPLFAAGFLYFAVTVFGGLSVLLWLRPRWTLSSIRHQPELASFLVVIVAVTAVGNWDIWRYLAFVYPAAVVLIARYCDGLAPDVTRRTLIAMTALTFITQRPFERLYEAIYFRDWFPLYNTSGPTLPTEFVLVWTARLTALVLMMFAVRHTLSRQWRATVSHSPSWQ